jgi:CheY-like chemotaxis protein
MTSVLVVDDDAPLRNALARELRANGYESAPASGYDEAMQRLSEHRYDVLLTDLRMAGRDGLQLITALAQSFPATRPILMSAYATARDSERALDLGAVRVLCKPFDSSEMLQAVERAAECASGFCGTVHGLSLIDMLQMFHYSQRSVTLRVLGGTFTAIHMRGGEIIHATHGEVHGEEALSQILTLPAGSLHTSCLETVTPTVERDFQPLMLDVLRRVDERRHWGSGSSGNLGQNDLARGHVSSAGGVGFNGTPRSSRPSSNGTSIQADVEWGRDLEGGQDASPHVSSVPPASSSGERTPQDSQANGLQAINLHPPDQGLLSDACRRTAVGLVGDVVCGVIDLETGEVLGSYAASGDARRRVQALARATRALFREAAADALGELSLNDTLAPLSPHQSLCRVELTLHQGMYLARATRRGRRVMVALAGRGADAAAVRSQLDAVFPLVEALAP